MSRIYRVEKSRKEYVCNNCRKIIPVGTAYLWSHPMHRSKIIRCTACGLQAYETGSEYTRTVGRIVNRWQEDYGVDEGTVDSIRGELESLKDTCESSLENMPDSLRESSPTAELLEERIDQLDGAMSALEDIDLDTLRADCEDDDYDDEDDFYDDEDGVEDETDDESDEFDDGEWSDELKEMFCASVDEALSELEY